MCYAARCPGWRTGARSLVVKRGAHAALARLHDLTLIEAHGVEVDTELARAAVEEAAQWLTRIGAPLLSDGPGLAQPHLP